MLEQQREDLELTLSEIALHEAQCRRLLVEGLPKRKGAGVRRVA
jgi:hypothetical protein